MAITGRKIRKLLFLVAGAGLLLTGAQAPGELLVEENLSGDMAVVTGKAPNCIIITSHSLNVPSKYLLHSDHARFIDIDGKVRNIKQLKVPCIAKIKFYHNETTPDAELRSLTVTKYDDGASSAYTMPEPFVRQPE